MGYILRPYQEETVKRLIENHKKGIAANLVVAGTGLGKTVILTRLHREFKPLQKTIFLVDRIELAYQAKEAFEKSDPGLRIGIEMNTHHASMKDDVIIACVQSIGRRGSYRIGKFKPEHFSLVCVDEAHGSVSDIYIRVLNYLQVGPDNFNKEKLLCGVTATPKRPDGVPLGKVYDEIVVNYDIRFGIKQGYLTDIYHIRVNSGVDISNDKYYTAKDFNTEELDRAINITDRNILIIKSYLEYCKDECAIVYSNSVDHAYELKALFNSYDITAEVIEAHTKKKNRKKWIDEYKKGLIKVLINYGTLIFGFNAPETVAVILGRPIRSELLLRQILGRGIRPSKYAFVDFIGSSEGRRQSIQQSVKPYCKVIDIHDTVGDHSIVSVPSLFGLNPKLKSPGKQKFFEEVVEPLEETQRDRKINISEIKNLDEVKMIVQKQKMNVVSLEIPEEIKKYSDRDWIKTNKDSYEIFYPFDKKSVIVNHNTLGKYEVLVQGQHNAIKLNDFYSLSGAIQLGDKYADKYFNIKWVSSSPWKQKGVTPKQYSLLRKMYKGRIGTSPGTYDTGVPCLYDRKLSEPIKNAGHASRLINEKRK